MIMNRIMQPTSYFFMTLSPSSHFLEATIQPITQEESTHSTFWTSYPRTDNRPQTHYKILILTVRRMKLFYTGRLASNFLMTESSFWEISTTTQHLLLERKSITPWCSFPMLFPVYRLRPQSMDRLRRTAFHRSTAVQVIIKPQVWLSLPLLNQKDISIFLHQHFNLYVFLAKTLD